MAVSNSFNRVFKRATSKKTQYSDMSAANDTSEWVMLSDDIAVQITGTASAANVVVERSTRNPSETANPAPVGDALTGNPSTGIAVATYYEPGVAWWRARLVSVTGSSVSVSITGTGE